LRAHGVLDYSIFLDPRDGSLFGCVEVSDEELWDRIALTDVCRRWWAYMAPLMDVHSDLSPRSEPLLTVFRFSAFELRVDGGAEAGPKRP
jgi:L-rhamnose mutarotase